MQLAVNKAVITDGGRGIGRSSASAYARHRAKLADAACRGDERGETIWLSEDLDQPAHAVMVDVPVCVPVQHLVAQTLHTFGQPHKVVNSQVWKQHKPTEEHDVEAITK